MMRARLCIVFVCGPCAAIAAIDFKEWRHWAATARNAAEAVNAHQRIHLAIDNHVDAQALLERTRVPPSVKELATQTLAHQKQIVEDVLNFTWRGDTDVRGHIAGLSDAEQNMKRMYNRLVKDGIVPHAGPASADDIASALKNAAGIDAAKGGDADAELFRITRRYWGDALPPSAVGTSAKFHADGRVERGRYHVAFVLSCDGLTIDDEKLNVAMTEAATALEAPSVVHSWVQAIQRTGSRALESMGFGVARLGEGQRAGKIYVSNTIGETLPPFPLGGDVTIGDVVPRTRESRDSQMVSLEWRFGGEDVVLRHYAFQREVSHEDRVREHAGHGAVGDGLVGLLRAVNGASETVACTEPFREADVKASGRPPLMSRPKVGLQLPGEFMADERFLRFSAPLLRALRVDEDGARQWLADSASFGHTVSNLQAVAEAGGSFLTLYRHPLQLCPRRWKDGPGNGASSRRLAATACEEAVAAYNADLWGEGSCKKSMKYSSECQSCVDSNEGDIPAACWAECEDSWIKPCSSNCSALMVSVISACKGCAPEKKWCGKEGENGLPSPFPPAACNKSSGDCSKDNVLASWIEENFPASAYDSVFNDGELVQLFEQLGPRNCRYPIYPWASSEDFPLCKRCDSVNNFKEQMNLWGGPCNYAKRCQDEDDAAACATRMGYKCGCDCARAFSDVNRYCGVGENTCDPKLPSHCVADGDNWHNNCNSAPHALGWEAGHIWYKKHMASACFSKLEAGGEVEYVSQCAQSYTLTDVDMRLAYRDSVVDKGALPANCCDSGTPTTLTLVDLILPTATTTTTEPVGSVSTARTPWATQAFVLASLPALVLTSAVTTIA